MGNSVTFGKWRFDRRHGKLFRGDDVGGWTPAAIGSRAADILAGLLREPGELVAKDSLTDGTWPGVIVQANNLTVQVSALRRLLDEGRTGDSCIQTVPGRGYRFVDPVVELDDHAAEFVSPTEPEPDSSPRTRPLLTRARALLERRLAVGLGGLALLLLLAVAWHGGWPGRAVSPGRMSIVVMPFKNLSGDPAEDYLADAITDDLTTDLTMTTDAFVVTPQAAYTFKGQSITAMKAGQELGVRYLLQGSVRKIGAVLHLNAQLVSTENAAVLWSDGFDVAIANIGANIGANPGGDVGAGEEAAVSRIRNALGMKMIAVEAARSRRERPDNADAFDLFLRARSLALQPPSPARLAEIRTLYERALQLDPSSSAVKDRLVEVMLDDEDMNPRGRKDVLEQTRVLLASDRTEQPPSLRNMLANLYWLRWQSDRCPETIDAARKIIAIYPRAFQALRWLGDCETMLGRAEQAIPVLDTAIALAVHDPYQSRNYRNMQFALLLLGRYDESIVWGQRALAANAEDAGWERARVNRRLSAAYALCGRLDDARLALAEANRISPSVTLRSAFPGAEPGTLYATQIARVRDGLRLAGMRDHVEEDADFGIAADHRLHQGISGPTPLTVPGATTIRTDDLVRLLAARNPLVIDSDDHSSRSIAGAIGLRYVGDGGDLSDVAQERLAAKMRQLTHGDLAAPVVAVGWNAETFDGRNLALRLAALGFSEVYWYRGGREAWEVRALPETKLTVQEW